jgi:L-malate glycosyltransferase
MRVAYTVLSPFISGAERSLQTMLQFLPEEGVEPVVICPPDSDIIPWCRSNRLPFDTCTFAYRDKWHPVNWWSSVRQMQSLLQRHNIDVVHSNQLWSYPVTGAAARSLRLPRVCHIRDEVAAEGLKWWLAPGVEVLLSISRYIEKQICAAWPPDWERPLIGTLMNPIVLPDPTTLPELPTRQERKQVQLSARRHLGIAEDTVVLGFIGQIVPVKGVCQLLEALAGLVQHANWKLLIAGRDPHPGAPHEIVCHQQVRQLGLSERVKFLGFLTDVRPFYQAVDLAVVPSLIEPMGRIPLEAASYAKPCVAFAAGGLPETIQHGKTGWLVPVGDVAQLRETLRNFLDSPSPDMGCTARRWVETISEPRRYAKNLADIYAYLISSKLPSTKRAQQLYTCISAILHTIPC